LPIRWLKNGFDFRVTAGQQRQKTAKGRRFPGSIANSVKLKDRLYNGFIWPESLHLHDRQKLRKTAGSVLISATSVNCPGWPAIAGNYKTAQM